MSAGLDHNPLASPAVVDQKTEVLIPGRTVPISMPSRLVDIPGVMKMLTDYSGRVNHLDGRPAPRHPLHFFTYMLREHFNLKFRSYLFHDVDPTSSWYEFFMEGWVLRDLQRDGGYPLLESYGQRPHVWSYHRAP